MKIDNRIGYIDAAKALGIIAVIVGHCAVPVPYLHGAIYSFHMPLFFIISGMFIRQKPVKEAMSKYARLYLAPYFASCLIIFIIGLTANLCLGRDFDYYGLLLRVIYGSGGTNARYLADIPTIGALWFLQSLFVSCVLFSIVERFSSCVKWSLIFLLMFAAIYSARVIQLPFNLQSGAFAVFYLEVGSLVKRHDIVAHIQGQKVALICWSILWLVFIYKEALGCYGWGYNLGLVKVVSPLALFVSVMAPLFVLVAMKCCHGRSLWLGRSTLAILCVHSIEHNIYKILGWPTISGGNAFVWLLIELMIALIGAACLQRIPGLNRLIH